MTQVALPAGVPVEQLGGLPPGVEVVTVDASGLGSARSAAALVVAPELAPALGELPALRNLELVQSLNAGVDWLAPHLPPGATLCSASGVHDAPVAEWVVGVTIAARRELPRWWADAREHRWDRRGNALVDADGIVADDLVDRHVVILGMGSIGRAVAERLRPFGAVVTGVASRARGDVLGPEALPGLLPGADVLVVLVPLTPATARVVDAAALAALPDGALVVNASRGGVLDQDALLAELRTGRLRAALDVTDPEPLPPEHPLWDAPGLLLTPHVAGSVRRWRRRAHAFAGEQLRRWAAGEPLRNVVVASRAPEGSQR